MPDAAPALADLSPMLATARASPFDDPDWVFEPKYDGYRLLAETGPRLRLQTRNGHDATAWFPELHRPLTGLGGRHVIDGEVCVLDSIGRSDFNLLHARAARRGWKRGYPEIVFCVFDVLVLDGESVMQEALQRRKLLLAKLMREPVANMLRVQHLAQDGKEMFAAACDLKLEGIVAKRLKSIYQPGARSPDWLKIKRPGSVPPERFRRT